VVIRRHLLGNRLEESPQALDTAES